MLPLSPTVDSSLITAEEARVATTGDLTNVADGDVLDEDGRVFAAHRVVYAQLAKLVVTHSVDIVIVSYKACVAIATSHQTNGNVVGAELGELVHLVSCQIDSQA